MSSSSGRRSTASPRWTTSGPWRLATNYPTVDVLVVTSFGETQRVHSALAAGASGYVLKDADVDEIHGAIVAARHGEIHLDPTVTEKLNRSVATGTGPAALTPGNARYSCSSDEDVRTGTSPRYSESPSGRSRCT